jgi:PAS domain S-box-containing protein
MLIKTLTSEQKDALLTTLWERSLVGVALVTKEGRFEFANEAFCRLVEYSEPELCKRRFHDITHPDDLAADVSMSRDIELRESDGYNMRKRYITKTGKVVWMILHVQGLIVDDELHYFVSQISEIFPVIGVPITPIAPPKKALSTYAFQFVKDNLAWIVLALSGFAYVLAEILKSLDEGSS